VTDAQTAILYALSTVAQTCAALAAFVGAVGVYRLQSLDAGHARNERTIRGLLGVAGLVSRNLVEGASLAEVLRIARLRDAGPTVHEAVTEWDGFAARRQRTTAALFAFKAWNLAVIGFAVVGFNYVPALAANAATFYGIWLAAVGTVAVTGYCVFVWTRE
jgi:hypothetical protein